MMQASEWPVVILDESSKDVMQLDLCVCDITRHVMTNIVHLAATSFRQH